MKPKIGIPNQAADDYAHMKQILLDSCPSQLNFEEPLSNKIKMIKHGNSKNFNDNTALVLKTMNKEDRYSHLILLDEIMCHFSPYCRHTTQTMVIKAEKNDHLCWDGSTTIKPTDIVMNQVTPLLVRPQSPLGMSRSNCILTSTIHVSVTQNSYYFWPWRM